MTRGRGDTARGRIFCKRLLVSLRVAPSPRHCRGEAAPGYWAHLLLIPGAELFGSIVPTPGGIGALEAAVASCYSMYAQALDTTVALKESQAAGVFTALGYRFITFVVAAIGVGYYRTARREISTVLEESANRGSEQTTDNQVAISEARDAASVDVTIETELTETEPNSS